MKRNCFLSLWLVMIILLMQSCNDTQQNTQDNIRNSQNEQKSQNQQDITEISGSTVSTSIRPVKRLILTEELYGSRFLDVNEFLINIRYIDEFDISNFNTDEVLDLAIFSCALDIQDNIFFAQVRKEFVDIRLNDFYDGITVKHMSTSNYELRGNEYVTPEEKTRELWEQYTKKSKDLEMREVYLNEDGTYSIIIDGYDYEPRKLSFTKIAIVNALVDEEYGYFQFRLIKYTSENILGSISAVLPAEDAVVHWFGGNLPDITVLDNDADTDFNEDLENYMGVKADEYYIEPLTEENDPKISIIEKHPMERGVVIFSGDTLLNYKPRSFVNEAYCSVNDRNILSFDEFETDQYPIYDAARFPENLPPGTSATYYGRILETERVSNDMGLRIAMALLAVSSNKVGYDDTYLLVYVPENELTAVNNIYEHKNSVTCYVTGTFTGSSTVHDNGAPIAVMYLHSIYESYFKVRQAIKDNKNEKIYTIYRDTLYICNTDFSDVTTQPCEIEYPRGYTPDDFCLYYDEVADSIYVDAYYKSTNGGAVECEKQVLQYYEQQKNNQ